jgi:protocadherin Fat 1/2/3
VRYEIQTDTSNSSEYFHIDPEDGSIYLKRSLDHELHDSHHFTVVAIDAGVPSLSSTAHVWVTGMKKKESNCHSKKLKSGHLSQKGPDSIK